MGKLARARAQFDLVDPMPSAELARRASAYADAATADNTRRAYRADLKRWAQWCMGQGIDPDTINPVTVAAYVTAHAERLKVATLQRRMAGLNAYQRGRGAEPVSTKAEPLRSVWAGIQRHHGAPQTQKKPVLVPDLRRIVTSLGDGPAAARDAALLVVGFAGAMRRADLVGLDWTADGEGAGFVEQTPDGLLVTFRRSKTDQTGEGDVIGLAYGSHPSTCPVRALARWRDAQALQLGGAWGPIFRAVDRHGNIGTARMDGGSVARMVKRRLVQALVDGGEGRAAAERIASNYAGHSLRAGFVTAAFHEGVPEAAIMPHTRHRKPETLYRYRRAATVFVDNPSARVGL